MLLSLVLLFLSVTIACFPHNLPETISFQIPIHWLMYAVAIVIAAYALRRLATQLQISVTEEINNEPK